MQYQGRNPSRQIAAMNITTAQPLSAWLPDSGATSHVTSDLSNLQLHSEYSGPNHVHVGDGSGLLISHIGKSILATLSRTLHLN